MNIKEKNNNYLRLKLAKEYIELSNLGLSKDEFDLRCKVLDATYKEQFELNGVDFERTVKIKK